MFSIGGAGPVVAGSVKNTILNHAAKKSKVGRDQVDAFAIIYVRPPGRPMSDINPETLQGLHSAIVDEVASDPERYAKYAGFGLIDMEGSLGRSGLPFCRDSFKFYAFPVDDDAWSKFGLVFD